MIRRSFGLTALAMLVFTGAGRTDETNRYLYVVAPGVRDYQEFGGAGILVVDTKSFGVTEVGPFSAPIRPFTVSADRSLCYVTVNKLLGFEIGDLKTGKKLHRVEVPGYKTGPVKRHGCPSHGVGLTPDERE